MNDTVTKILDLVGEYAEHYAEDRKWGTFTADTTKSHQALQDELVRLFTPLTDEHVDDLFAAVVDKVNAGEIAYESVGLARAVEAMHGITGEKNETT
jgi:hypothetical protein